MNLLVGESSCRSSAPIRLQTCQLGESGAAAGGSSADMNHISNHLHQREDAFGQQQPCRVSHWFICSILAMQSIRTKFGC